MYKVDKGIKPKYERYKCNTDPMFVAKRSPGGDIFVYKCIKPHYSNKKNSPVKPAGKLYWEKIGKWEESTKVKNYLVVNGIRYDKFWWTGGRLYKLTVK